MARRIERLHQTSLSRKYSIIMNATDTYRIYAISHGQSQHYQPLLDDTRLKLIETSATDADSIEQVKPDLIVSLSPSWYADVGAIEIAKSKGIPTLLILDGILEWRHQWTNSKSGAGGRMLFAQSVTADKIACLGWQNARTLEMWDNVGKCEIVGVPRFDKYLNYSTKSNRSRKTKRLLIMTANTPGFTPEQTHQVEQALRDIQNYLGQNTDWEPIWRVRGGYSEKLQLQDNFHYLQGQPLENAFAEADAVLTTPSTVILEAMLMGLPVALLDYTNSPDYVSAAWKITAKDHIPHILKELLTPDATRLIYQDEVLKNNLACNTPATPRLADLMCEMARLGREAHANNKKLELPDRILPITLGGHAIPSEHYDYAKLYPHHPVFQNRNLIDLQIQLTQARDEVRVLKQQLASRSLGYWFRIAISKLNKIIRQKH